MLAVHGGARELPGLKNLCPDGTPAGYELFTVDGSDLKWEHKAFEYPEDRQFYAWDMNGVKDYFANNLWK